MKKTSGRRRPMREEMRREYRFDYRKSRPNRFAPLMKGRTVAVVLDPDIAAVFQSSESVNSLLRSVITSQSLYISLKFTLTLPHYHHLSPPSLSLLLSLPHLSPLSLSPFSLLPRFRNTLKLN